MRLVVTDRRRFRTVMTVVGSALFGVVAARAWVLDRALVLDLESVAVGASLVIVIGLLVTADRP